MENSKLENIDKNNFWQVIHDTQRGQYYSTRLTLLNKFYLINETIQLY